MSMILDYTESCKTTEGLVKKMKAGIDFLKE